ncbi:RNA polymerase sigma factor [Chryseobacterium sp. FH2]|uniref:RNA polymerase sigma factor n=1 Tax=Chryseobacterium sp. FH2 TaxID=1674291 RepID=UPI00065AD7A3|nr:sigma-70 family RNA polymerase sigma factor [Chryseobacterium sp. FH2]
MTKLNWQKIYENHSPKLLGICRRYIHDIHTAEDILQDSFIVAIQNNHQLRDENALFGWLKKIVVNNALQYLRKNSKNVFVDTEPSEIPDTFSEMNHPSLDEKKHIFIYDFTREELLSSIDNLPSHHKSVFNLHFIENYSHAEISSALGISVNTSKSHLMRAKKFIQNYLMNNVVTQSTPKNKKKLAQLLVIFGLGGLLWAQTFQNKFSDFKIKPSKSLELPDNIKFNHSISFSTSNKAWKKKIVIGSTVLIIIAASVFLLSPKNYLSINNNPVISDDIKSKDTSTSENSSQEQNSDVKTTSNGNIVRENSSIINSIENKNIQENISETKINLNEKSTKNSKKTIRKDSAKESRQKVIVVKKVIQRDTIFIER